MQNVEDIFLEVGRAIDEQEMAEAKSLLEEILMIDPGYGRAHNHLGWIYETKFKDFRRARQHYELALKFCRGTYPVVYVNYAYLLIEFGNFNKASKIIEEGLKVSGTDKAALTYQKGRILENKKKYKEALTYYKEAVNLTFNQEFSMMLEGEIERAKSKIPFLLRIFR